MRFNRLVHVSKKPVIEISLVGIIVGKTTEMKPYVVRASRSPILYDMLDHDKAECINGSE